VAQCPKCGYQNPDREILCIKCGLPLENVRDGATRRLEASADAANFPRWGTARLGKERKLLLHIRGHDKPLVVHISDTLILGRQDTDTGEAPEIDLADYGAQELGVSRRHAAILVEDDALKVMDLGSANSTYMNGQKLIAHQARILRDGDELRLARLVVRINFA
jgi:hypothetical protein